MMLVRCDGCNSVLGDKQPYYRVTVNTYGRTRHLSTKRDYCEGCYELIQRTMQPKAQKE